MIGIIAFQDPVFMAGGYPLLLEWLSMTSTPNGKGQDEISFSPKHGETWFDSAPFLSVN